MVYGILMIGIYMFFLGKTWTDIVNDPRTYINAMWFDFDREVSAYFKPYPNYQFIRGRPFLKIANHLLKADRS